MLKTSRRLHASMRSSETVRECARKRALFFLGWILTLVAHAAWAATPAEEIADLALKNTDAASRAGLSLYLNPSDVQGPVKLAAGEQRDVQCVVFEKARAESLRASLKGAAEAERVSVVWRRTAHLPYLDNLINLLVAENWGKGDLKDLPLSELLRVIRPGGLAVVGCDSDGDASALLAEAGKLKASKAEKLERKGAWIKIVKLSDPDMGEWCSEASQGITTVNNDRAVAPSKEVRWVNTPLWGNSWTSYMGESSGNYGKEIFSGGRSYHTEISWIKPGVAQYELVARDAYNGCVLWREKIPTLSSVRASDDACVYVSEGKDLIAHDGRTGKQVKNYGPVAGRFVQHARDRLILSVYVPFAVIDKESGKTVWTRPYNYAGFPPAYKDGVVFMPGSTVEAVNLADGKTLWKAAPKELATAGDAVECIACKGDTLYVQLQGADNGNKLMRLVAMDASNGNVRWSNAALAHGTKVMPFDDQIWLARIVKAKGPKGEFENYEYTALDAKTGKEIKTITAPKGTGCWGVRATDRYLVWSRGSFLDRKTYEITETFGVRSSCGVGPTPAYGLLYYEPHTCNCYVALRGVYALSGGSQLPKGEVSPQVLTGSFLATFGAPATEKDWPIYRANSARSNASETEIPGELKQLWSSKLSAGGIPQATGANGFVFVAVPEQHRVVALDLATGAEKWSFGAEGRISLPPTYYKGLCLFGDHAGWVYCLDAATGRLAWQMQAAPEQKYMSAYDRLESSWPVKSGVLTLDDSAYFVAGRCGTMDGGVYYYGVDTLTGAVQVKKNFSDSQTWVRAPKTADLLLCDGRNLIGWGGGLETAKPLAKPAGGKETPPQKIMKFGTTWQGPNAIIDMLATMNPAGSYMKSRPSDGRADGEAISFNKDRTIVCGRLGGNKNPKDGHGTVACKGVSEWTNNDTKEHMRALLLSGSRVYCAGEPEFLDPQEKPALVVLAAADGQELQRIPLESAPSVDGLSAIGGKIVLTTTDGRVLCFEGKK